MKYNKKEQQAIETLERIVIALKNKKGIAISQAENTNLSKNLGINFKKITFRRGEVEKFIFGKHQLLLEVHNCWASSRNLPSYHCYFPFQVKSIKE